MWISILRLLLLLLHILEVVIGASWEQRPTDVSAPVGSTVTLTCKVTGDPGFVTWNKNGNTLAVGTSVVSSDTRITVPVASKFNLQITNLQKSDDDDYTCNIQNIQPDSQKAVTVHLTVLVAPGQPSISINDTRPQKVEKDVVSLTCSSSGGNPPPEFTWTKNGLVLNSNIIVTKVPNGLSSSQLTVHLDYSDHLAPYSCSVRNSVNQNNPFSTSTQISVLYHPRITFKPYKDLSLELGSAGSLTCNVSANPPVNSISWTKDGQPLQTTNSRIDFSPASKTDSGSYSCSSSNSINGITKPATDTAIVNVLYPPVITIPEVYEVNESATLDITCNVDAYPTPFYTRWQKTDNSIQSNNNRLTIDNIKRSHKGNYSCISKNAMRPSGDSERIEERIKYTYLYVRYSPGSSNIAPVSPVFVGNSLTLTCSVSDPGYPAPTYEWRKVETNQLLATETSQLIINGVTLQDNGNYSCTPKNMMGRGGSSTVPVVVNEKPTYVGVHKDKDTIYNNRTGYWLQCKVRGRPEPLIQWYKNGKPLDTSGKLYRLTTTVLPVDTFSFLVTSQVYLQGSDRVGTTTPQISDVASYTCKETTSNINHTTQLFIYFPPTITPDEKEASIAGGTAQLKCFGEGYPVPNFVWKRNNAVISSGGRLTIHQTKVISVTRSESLLQIDRIVGQDFGPYTCEMSNQFGKTTKTITLTVKSKPEAPTSLSSPKRSWDKVTLRWTPGFNGGSYQAFVVKYKSNPPNAGDQSIRVMPDNATEFTISNLLPSTAYVFQVCGYNELGEGDLSDSITITTNGYTFPFIKETPEFSGDNKELILNLDVNSTFCVKVKVSTNGGQSWQTFTNNDLECFDANVAKMIVTTNGVDKMNVSLCLVERMDVCGQPVSVRISSSSTPDLTETEVIIIGCVCAAILVALLTVLVCIICRRRNLAKQLPPQTSPNIAANGHTNIPPQKPPRGYDNTGIQGLDLVQTHGAHAGVSYINPSYSHDDYSEMNRNGYPPFPRHNGNVPIDHDSSYDPEYENEMNRLNANKSNYFNEKQGDISFTGSPRSTIKDKQYIDMSSEHRKGDLINGQESGYNTPDNPKPPKKTKAKEFEANLTSSNYYFSDSVPFAHDPPGHNCGLPCCNRDLHIHLKLSGVQGCMSLLPFQPKPEKQDNFSFHQKRGGLISGRPTFSKKFSSLQPERKSQRRKPLPGFGSLRQSDVPSKQLYELSGKQHHYLKERGITLPRMHIGETSTDTGRIWQDDIEDSSESSDSETDYYTIWECNGMDSEILMKSPSALKNTEKIYPWTLLEHMGKQPDIEKTNVTQNQNVPKNFKYGSLPMCYKTQTESGTPTKVQKPVKQSETKVFTLNFDRKRLTSNDKRHTLERTSVMPSNNTDPRNEVRFSGEQPKTKSSTLPRSSVRIRPILKKRIENIYTDLITSPILSRSNPSAPPEETEDDHNYEQIRDEDMIQSWRAQKRPVFMTIGKKLPGREKGNKFHSYENTCFKPDEAPKNKTKDFKAVSDDIPITLIL